jgi:hypothetical protein
MSSHALEARPVWGFAGLLFGILALFIVVLHVSSLLEPADTNTATKIGEFAAELRKSATRSMLGQPQPVPETPAMGLAEVLAHVAPVLAVLATILGAIGLFRREPRTLSLLALGFGTGAFVMQFAMMLALLMAGAFIMVAILNNLGSILGD